MKSAALRCALFASVVLVVATTTSCGSGGTSRTTPALKSPGGNNDCPLTRRAVTASHARGTLESGSTGGDCPPGGGGVNNDPLFGDMEYFAELEDAIDGGVDPCDAPSPICGNYPDGQPAQIASAGAPAQRGDNCTPYNNYAIGYSIPGAQPITPVMEANTTPTQANGAGTIVNQTNIALNNTSITGGGSQPVGWLLTTQSAGIWFVPNATVQFGMAATSVPAAIMFGGKTNSSAKSLANAARSVLNAYSNFVNVPLPPVIKELVQMQTTTVSLQACNTAPLNPYT